MGLRDTCYNPTCSCGIYKHSHSTRGPFPRCGLCGNLAGASHMYLCVVLRWAKSCPSWGSLSTWGAVLHQGQKSGRNLAAGSSKTLNSKFCTPWCLVGIGAERNMETDFRS